MYSSYVAWKKEWDSSVCEHSSHPFLNYWEASWCLDELTQFGGTGDGGKGGWGVEEYHIIVSHSTLFL